MKGRSVLLDLLCARFSDREREHLLSLVLCGDVLVDGAAERDPRTMVAADATLDLRPRPYASRGGRKLAAAIETFEVDVRGNVFLDAGSSTGGFTDCLLRHGASFVHAVDVGRNQLAYRLRIDPRVRVHEQTAIQAIETLDPTPHGAVADLSFRSLRGVARHIIGLTSGRWAILLIKPQFEWRAAPLEFDGVVPEPDLPSILRDVLEALADEGVVARRLMESPLRGRKGNREYLLLARGAASGAVGELDSLSPADLFGSVFG